MKTFLVLIGLLFPFQATAYFTERVGNTVTVAADCSDYVAASRGLSQDQLFTIIGQQVIWHWNINGNVQLVQLSNCVVISPVRWKCNMKLKSAVIDFPKETMEMDDEGYLRWITIHEGKVTSDWSCPIH